jgi:hypothetical protein
VAQETVDAGKARTMLLRRIFDLASRAVAELFDCTHTTAANWLRALALIDVIEVVSVGDLAEHRASEYRYIAD